ncbi:MAG TPA: SDR family oxidoreductase [Rhizobiales bacterium]|nr:SDR family oxidoreductase [Hyphomicrobiales bacterium]
MQKTIKTALVTGAGKRIGRQIAIDLARDGWAVGVHYSSSDADAKEVVAKIIDAGGRAVTVKGDLADRDSPAEVVAKTCELLGPLTLLVNNASLFERDEIGDMVVESWDRHLDINLRGPVLLAQAFANQMPDGQQGNIVNLIDQRVWRLTPDFFSYTISKAGLWTATQTLAQALAPEIRVNAIGPGPALPSSRMTISEFEKQCKLMPLEVGTSPAEISSALAFILSAPAMTGQMIALDGGQHLGWKTPDFTDVSE